MKVGRRGRDLIKSYEKLRLKAYKPHPKDRWTIGYGHTKGVKKGDTCTEAQAEKWFREDLRWVEDAVNACGPMKQHQFDAVASLVFNIGAGRKGFGGSKIRKLLKAGNYADCDLEFPKWRRSGGKIMRGLRRRRAAELALFVG